MKRRIMLLVLTMVLLCGTVFSYAAADTAVTIVSPGETVYGDNLLISIKVTAPRTLKISLYEEKQKVGDTLVSIDPETADLSKLTSNDITSVSYMTTETYTATGNLQFYSKQLEKVSPGLYRLKVETVNSAGEVTASSSSRFVMMKQNANAAAGSEIFQTTQQPGALQWVQNFLKSLFGN